MINGATRRGCKLCPKEPCTRTFYRATYVYKCFVCLHQAIIWKFKLDDGCIFLEKTASVKNVDMSIQKNILCLNGKDITPGGLVWKQIFVVNQKCSLADYVKTCLNVPVQRTEKMLTFFPANFIWKSSWTCLCCLPKRLYTFIGIRHLVESILSTFTRIGVWETNRPSFSARSLGLPQNTLRAETF